MTDIVVWVFIGYLLVLVAIGFISERFTKRHECFVLGDRKMGPGLTALSYLGQPHTAVSAFPYRPSFGAD